MSIRAIPRTEFDQLLANPSALESLMVEEVEWFSNWSGDLLGTIAKGKSVAGWNYVILKRDRKGEVHVRKVMSNFFDLKAARVDLLLSMAEMEKIDQVDRKTAIFGLASVPAELSALNQGRQHGQPSKASSRSGKASD
jgi:hypothetical protein